MGLSRPALAAVVLALAATTACGSSSGEEPSGADSRFGHAEADDISLSDGWATEAPKAPTSSDPTDMSSTMSAVSGAYFTLSNDSDDADALVGVATDAAKQAQLHTTESTGGGTSGTMKRVTRVPVPAHGETRLEVGGYHVMLVSPTRALSAGDEVPLRLTFASGTSLDVRLPVLDREDRPR